MASGHSVGRPCGNLQRVDAALWPTVERRSEFERLATQYLPQQPQAARAAEVASPPQSDGDARFERLLHVMRWRNAGLLSDTEFAAAKQQLGL